MITLDAIRRHYSEHYAKDQNRTKTKTLLIFQLGVLLGRLHDPTENRRQLVGATATTILQLCALEGLTTFKISTKRNGTQVSRHNSPVLIALPVLHAEFLDLQLIATRQADNGELKAEEYDKRITQIYCDLLQALDKFAREHNQNDNVLILTNEVFNNQR